MTILPFGTPPSPWDIGHPGTEQWSLHVEENGRPVSDELIHDPFLVLRISPGGGKRVPWWRRVPCALMLLMGQLEYRVAVNGSQGAHRAVFGFDYAAHAIQQAQEAINEVMGRQLCTIPDHACAQEGAGPCNGLPRLPVSRHDADFSNQIYRGGGSRGH